MKKEIFSDIVLDREEQYDATKLNCWAFCSGTDVKNGVELKLGNMLSGFPIVINNVCYPCSEILYLCGRFSNNTTEHQEIRDELIKIKNGYTAKKVVKNKNKELIREDFDKFSTEWMLWVVWQKTQQNKEFQRILKSIPSNAVIIEDSSWQTSKTSTLWGCKNRELRKARANRKKELTKQGVTDSVIKTEVRKIDGIGTFIGKNNMGKILMLCKRALENNTEPPIDYALLKSYHIYLNSDKPLF